MRKICLSAYGHSLDGYENIPYYLITNPLSSLNDAVANGEASEIIAEDVLEYTELDQYETVVQNIATKLEHGGTLILSVRDINEVMTELSSKKLPIEELNRLLFGSPKVKSVYSGKHLFDLFTKLGLQIVHKRWDGSRLVVTGRRP